MNPPIALLIFNRPDSTRKVFEVIRKVKPEKLFVVADGPREQKPEEVEKCQAAREVIESVDWPCEVLKNYSEKNLGCRDRVASGISWVFDNSDRAIFLEDDCVPDLSFFHYCQILLEQYKDDERVFSITGHNHLGEWKPELQSYFFSNYFDCWGWATWRRVWQKYDPEMRAWAQPEAREQVRQVIADDKQFFNRAKVLEATYSGAINSWAYPFFFMSLLHGGLTVTPAVNLIKNIGFGEEASNTSNPLDLRGKVLQRPLNFPLQPPSSVTVDRDYDYERYKKVWRKSLKRRLASKLKKLVPLTIS